MQSMLSTEVLTTTENPDVFTTTEVASASNDVGECRRRLQERDE